MIAFGNTNKGTVRQNNQDSYAVELFDPTDAALLVVCDGMGGANAGNVASGLAVNRFLEEVRPKIAPEMGITYVEDMLRVAAQCANQSVFELSISRPEFQGMGTTLVAALVQGQNVALVNVGDSRAYLLRGGQAYQLTEDHSYVQEMVRKGRLTPEESRIHPHKNLITRAVGVDAFVDSDLFQCTLADDDVLLLCSDGLTGMVTDEEITRIVGSAPTLQQAVGELIDRACENGGVDNITVVLFCRGGLTE